MGYRTVFNMLEIEGFSYKEVSDYLKISEAGCRSQLSRAKKLLRKKLNNINF
jgi:RNA polymerase sigma-70 factor (ECF subfamily)